MVDYAFIARLLLGIYLLFTGLTKLPDLKGFVALDEIRGCDPL